jgi:lipopolysaccharide biosynthesis protein
MLPLLFAYMENINGCSCDFYFTIPNDRLVNDIKRRCSNANVLIVDNIGFDIFPFLECLHRLDLNDYDLILKLHSKRNIPIKYKLNDFDLSGNLWREYLLDAILGTNERFSQILSLFQEDNCIGMIGAKELVLYDDEVDKDIDVDKVENILNENNLLLVKKEFIAGSMFIARAFLFKSLKERRYRSEDFPPYYPRNWNGLPYLLERYFGFMVSSQGYCLLGLNSPLKNAKQKKMYNIWRKIKSYWMNKRMK